MIKLKQFPTLSEDFLRQKSEPVKDAQEARELVAKILDYYPDKGAYGVACPQIGILKQAFVAKLPPQKDAIFVCNPEVLNKSGRVLFKNEGCLSFPKKRKDTIRFTELKVKYRDEQFEERIVLLHGIEAIIFQHEIDHLNGVLYKDNVAKPIRKETKIGRNEPCPCGSNKKYKKCCGG